MPKNFADLLLDEMDARQNPSCFGLDPRIREVPRQIRRKHLETIYGSSPHERWERRVQATVDAIFEYVCGLIDVTYDIVPAYKANIAFYEKYGWRGIRMLENVFDHIRSKGCVPLTDGKRNDIGDTAEAYAQGHLGAVELIDGTAISTGLNTGAITVTAYIGSDTVRPFMEEAKRFGKGVIVLAKTSNDSSGELQDLWLDKLHGGRQVFEEMALRIHIWGEEMKGNRGYSAVCAVVGANYPEHAERAREIMERNIILVPAYGLQGARGVHCVPNFTREGYGAIISNSRGLMSAYTDDMYKRFGEANCAEASRQAAIDMKADLHQSMKSARKFPW